MLEECHNPRDRAAIALQFDAGLRGGELEDLKIGGVSDTDTGLIVSVDGKTGQRSIDLIPSVPALQTESPMRISEVARMVDRPRRTVRRLLDTLKEADLITESKVATN